MTPSPNQPPTTLGQFLPLSIIRMIWKQRLPIICGCFLLTSIAAVYIKGLPNIYRADAVIMLWEWSHAYRVIPLDGRPRISSGVRE